MDQDEIKDLLRNHKEAFFSLRRSYKMMLVALIIYTLSFGWCNLKNLEKAQFLEDRVRQLEQTINKQPTCCPPCPEQAPSEADDPKATPSPAPSGSHRIVDGVDVDEPCIINDSIYLLHLPYRRARILRLHLVIAGPSSVSPSPHLHRDCG